MNLSVITLPSIRTQGVIEVRNQNLYGPEPSIDRWFEGGNMKLTCVTPGNALEIRTQNLYGSECMIAFMGERILVPQLSFKTELL